MARPSTGKWVKDKFLVLPGKEDCYIYKRPNSNTWQYYLQIPGEGEERKSTKIKGSASDVDVGKEAALEFALNRKLEVMSRQKQRSRVRICEIPAGIPHEQTSIIPDKEAHA